MSTMFIIFTLFVKMMVPIAHAGNLLPSNQQKSFLASLCYANKIIQVEFTLPANEQSKEIKSAVKNAAQCPLCVIADLNAINHDIPSLHDGLNVTSTPNTYFNDTFFSYYQAGPNTIRGPPVLS